MKHFKVIDQIKDVPDHPKNDHLKIGGIMKCDFSEIIHIVFEEETEEPIMTHFYCSECQRWCSFYSSIGNIHSHLRYKHQEQKNQFSNDEIIHSFICFLLTNDLPFRLIEDPHLANFCQNQYQGNA